jgi:transposase InsO family protein
MELRKRQLTNQQRYEIITAILSFGLICIGGLIRHCQCAERTIWYIWQQYKNNGNDLNAVKLKIRRPQHPAEHTPDEHNLIVTTLANNPTMSYTRLYTLLCRQGYTRSYKGLWGYCNKHKLRGVEYVKHNHHRNKPYNTPYMCGMKMQMDIKYVPTPCITPYFVGKQNSYIYQYSIMDESNRKCFEMSFPEKSTYSTTLFLQELEKQFGYLPIQIQTDNGTEFTNKLIAGAEHEINLVDEYLNDIGVDHKLIPPATPRQNGKIERRHREDHRHYQNKKFDNIQQINDYLKDWCKEKDNTFTFALCPKCQKSPNMRFAEQLQELKQFKKEVLKLPRRSTLQEMIYAYCEYERIKQERQEKPPKHILHLPPGIELADDIKIILAEL